MQRIPVEVAERIIANLSDKDLFIGSSVCRVWWQEVRREAYKRWKFYATTIGDIYWGIQSLGKQFEKGDIDWIKFESVNDIFIKWMDHLTEDKLYIMEKMLRNGMIVDSQEEEIIRHAISENNWGGNPWKFEWEWNEYT